MGRRERPLEPGPLQEFAADLRELRARTGLTYRALSHKARYSPSALSAAASGDSLPTLDVLQAYVAACGGNSAAWEQRWRILAQDLSRRSQFSISTVPAAASGKVLPAGPVTPAYPRRHVGKLAVLASVSAAVTIISVVAVLGSHPASAGPPAATATHLPGRSVSTPPGAPQHAYDAYVCAGGGVPRTVTLSPANDPRLVGWQRSRPAPWGAPQCKDQIWWTPYTNGGVNPVETFSWTFATSIRGKAACTVWAYYPPPPSGHAAGTAHYSIQDGTGPSAPRLAYVAVALRRNKGTWYRLGTFDIASGDVKLTLGNQGTDPDPEHGVIAGPIHVSCRG